MDGPNALLLTGIYGTGKSTVLAEVAELLEAAGTPFAAVDLDWLWWFSVGKLDEDLAREVLRANLSALISNYAALGIARFALALHVRSTADLEAVHAGVDMPIFVIRLTAPIDEVERRLRAANTTGRAHDLTIALDDHARGVGVGIEDAVLPNAGRPVEAARAAVRLAGWTSGP